MDRTQLHMFPLETSLTGIQLSELLPQERIFLLESRGSRDASIAAYSFLGAEPYRMLTSEGEQVFLVERGTVSYPEGDPLDILTQFISEVRLPYNPSYPPFQTGAVGFFAYDLGRRFELLPVDTKDELLIPDLYFAFYDVIIAINEISQEKHLLVLSVPGYEEESLAKAAKWKRLIEKGMPESAHSSLYAGDIASAEFSSTFTQLEYQAAVKRAIEYIYAGDVFQVNLSQRFTAAWSEEPFELYKHLRVVNPAPFSAYLDCGSFAIASASPERFLKWYPDGDKLRIETRPIKGTRPRGTSASEDQFLRAELWRSKKDQAELAMIVDLLRNDLGRICQYGTVVVPDRRRIEEYATVFHTVATVEGVVRKNLGLREILKATFPGGSITGAPKIRSMEIIEELESVRRGVYCGAIGYLGFNNAADFSIAIRSFVIQDQIASFHAGGGVVADSDPVLEYEETLHKVRALFQALRGSQSEAN